MAIFGKNNVFGKSQKYATVATVDTGEGLASILAPDIGEIPKFVIELMGRSKREMRRCKDHKNFTPHYTIAIDKRTEYAKVETLEKEVKRLCKWANKVGGEGTAFILSVPEKTHYAPQQAIVTIYDPVMAYIEEYMQH